VLRRAPISRTSRTSLLRSSRRVQRVIGCLALLCGAASPAAADDTTHSCVAAAHEGQRLRDAGKLRDGRAELVRCTVESCPDVVRESCGRWIGELDTRLPTIVLGARDEQNVDLSRVHVAIDGEVVAEMLDGRSLPVDPGPHTVVFDAPGKKTVRMFLLAREGEKVRSVSAVLSGVDAAPAALPERNSGPDFAPMLVAGGAALLAIGGFAIFGALGQSEKNHLRDTCADSRTCDSSDVSAARTKLIVADVFLVAAIGAAVVSGVFYFRLGRGSPSLSSR
jgi:hypothetical protein